MTELGMPHQVGRVMRMVLAANGSRDGLQSQAGRQIREIQERRALAKIALPPVPDPAKRAAAPVPVAPEPALVTKLKEKILRTDRAATNWTFLSNYCRVLVMIAGCPETRMRDIAVSVGITERAVHRIVDDLGAAGYIKVFKTGRRNLYEVQMGMPLRHPSEASWSVGDLLHQFVRRPH